jgi:hypothetical protein
VRARARACVHGLRSASNVSESQVTVTRSLCGRYEYAVVVQCPPTSAHRDKHAGSFSRVSREHGIPIALIFKMTSTPNTLVLYAVTHFLYPFQTVQKILELSHPLTPPLLLITTYIFIASFFLILHTRVS